jgi:hypothetical protein
MTHFGRCIQVFAWDGIYVGFAGAKTGHRRMALGRRLIQPAFPSALTPLASPASFGRRDTHTKFAVGLGGIPTNTP